MDSDTSQPLLADTEANLHPEQTKQAAINLSIFALDAAPSWTTRMAILFSIIVFSLLAGHMGEEGGATAVGILATVIWTPVTVATLIFLLYMGHRRNSGRKFGRTTIQVLVLCGLAVFWLFLSGVMIPVNSHYCVLRAWVREESCHLFTAAHVFAWLLIVSLFSAAYATYRRAVNIHGNTLVPLPAPPMVAAWRISNVADSEGVIKI
ncbi:hypothetical protein B0H19DRAFT_1061481 [Mycena capillaripes]|nr:hypothetical protein B0H19DRAFT_1061481 [Mycena capillaripes]